MILVTSYIVAFILNGMVNMVALLILIPFKPLILRCRSFSPVAHFLYAFVSGAGSVWAYTALSHSTFLELAYFMLLVPAMFQLMNDMKRVSLAKRGLSGVKWVLESIEDQESYNQATDIRSEQGAEFGRSTGFIIGMALFVGNAPFFG